MEEREMTGKNNMKIRNARRTDVNSLYRMARNDLGRFSWFHKESLIKNLKEEPKLCFVLECNKKTEGALFFRQEWNDVVWEWLIFLHGHMQHKGLAQDFEKNAMRILRKKGYKIAYAEVDLRNRHMLHWCRKNGYKKVCRFPDWFGNGKHAVIFRKNIK
ncbi:hypothetical protein HYZ41_00395 [archaeon]|nr:hypothetical protein [archaeon]